MGENPFVESNETAGESRTLSARIEPLRVRGAEPSAGFAPTGPSAEHGFFSERLAVFASIAWMASGGFLVMRLVLDTLARQRSGTPSQYGFPFFHLAATIILFLVWLWVSNLALLLGAELNSELERGRELDAGLPAENDIQLPPRAAPSS